MIPLVFLAFLFFHIANKSVIARTLSDTIVQTNVAESTAQSTGIQPLLHAIDGDFLGQRSTLDIIWSCFATIFACTWASVHMNIPAASESDWKIMGRRFKIMIYMLLLPELILYWASKQWYAAVETGQKHSARGWTTSHGFFIGMGGFVLYEDGKIIRPLDIDELEDTSEMGELDWPNISEDDILDKSKGDYFTKGVVVLQTTWFIFQCIARWVLGLALTELELVSLAFAALSGAVCFFWWKKPLDVRRPVVILGKGTSLRFSNRTENGNIEVIRSPIKTPSSTEEDHRERRSSTERGLELDEPDVYLRQSPTQGTRSHPSLLRVPSPPKEILTPIGRTHHGHKSNSIHNPMGVLDLRVANFSPVKTIPRPTPRNNFHQTKYVSDYERAIRNAAATNSRFTGKGILLTLISPIHTLVADVYELKDSGSIITHANSTNGDGCHVSTFYAAVRLKIHHKLSIFLFAAGTIFGGIHCIAWVYQFPNVVEEWMWKASALSITVLPSFFALHWVITSWLPYTPNTGLFRFSFSGSVEVARYLFYVTSNVRLALMFCIYVLARTFLLVLPFVSLRALPASAYVDISWTNVVPHI